MSDLIPEHVITPITVRLKEVIAKYVGMDYVYSEKTDRAEWRFCLLTEQPRDSPDVVLKSTKEGYRVIINLEEGGVILGIDSEELGSFLGVTVMQFANRCKLNKRNQTKQKGKEMLNDDKAIEMNFRVMELVASYPQVSATVVEDIVITTVFSIAINRKHHEDDPWSQLRISIMNSTIPTPLEDDNVIRPTYIVAWKGDVACLSDNLDDAMKVLERLIREHLLTVAELEEIAEISDYKKRLIGLRKPKTHSWN